MMSSKVIRLGSQKYKSMSFLKWFLVWKNMLYPRREATGHIWNCTSNVMFWVFFPRMPVKDPLPLESLNHCHYTWLSFQLLMKWLIIELLYWATVLQEKKKFSFIWQYDKDLCSLSPSLSVSTLSPPPIIWPLSAETSKNNFIIPTLAWQHINHWKFGHHPPHLCL